MPRNTEETSVEQSVAEAPPDWSFLSTDSELTKVSFANSARTVRYMPTGAKSFDLEYLFEVSGLSQAAALRKLFCSAADIVQDDDRRYELELVEAVDAQLYSPKLRVSRRDGSNITTEDIVRLATKFGGAFGVLLYFSRDMLSSINPRISG